VVPNHAELPSFFSLARCLQGSLLFYDFGMMGEIVPNIKDKLLEVFYGIYRKDANQVLSCGSRS
jgi:predicted unusual protein kinase regulating ubiquinone biosynthesis (AarF/ABC1/UbiB family)